MSDKQHIDKVDLHAKLTSFQDHWSPKIIGALNGQHVKLAKFYGEFVWHQHEGEDELFLVLRGQLEIHLRGRPPVVLDEGELFIVPRGVEHKPVAAEEAHVLLFEPAATVNTGDVRDHRTIIEPESI